MLMMLAVLGQQPEHQLRVQALPQQLEKKPKHETQSRRKEISRDILRFGGLAL